MIQACLFSSSKRVAVVGLGPTPKGTTPVGLYDEVSNDVIACEPIPMDSFLESAAVMLNPTTALVMNAGRTLVVDVLPEVLGPDIYSE
ncbi:hypothetical protein KIPB_008881 [Kipferlia bialata]|uniref:Uncharacterized protein n=1 Tax=Kipferlia bialata TaxID=797122 RepID=A0A391NNH9_9EUKA|nr:hypothetical protein KIPB_008881 [Kipferlia bialata]|eukprot:g8881.t1